MQFKKYPTNRRLGTGDGVPQYKLSNDKKKHILNLFIRNPIDVQDTDNFFKKLETCVSHFLLFTEMEKSYSSKVANENLSEIYKYSKQLHHHLTKCNMKTLNYACAVMVNAGYLYNRANREKKYISISDKLISETLEAFNDSYEVAIKEKRKVRGKKHNTIHHVSKGVISAVRQHAPSYSINGGENCLATKVLTELIDELEYDGDASQIIKSYLLEEKMR